MDAATRDRWLEHASRRMTAAGLRAGAARTAVVETLAREGQCLLTAGEIADRLRGASAGSIVAGGAGTIAADRRTGFLRAIRRHGLDGTVVEGGDFTEEAGIRAAHEILSGTLPTAVVCANDRIAVGVLDTLRRAGVGVPADVSVTGYDDSTLARLANVDLTTVSQQPRAQADRAIADVVSRLDGGRTERMSSTLVPELVVRTTTGPPS